MAPRRPEIMQKPCKNMFLRGFVKTHFRRPQAAQDAPKEAQEAARTTPERPGAAQGRAKRGPRAAKRDPKGGPLSFRTGQGAALKWVPREARERLQKGSGEAQHTTQEDTRAEKPRQEGTRGDKTTEDKTRGKTRQQTDKRSSGVSKPRTP